MKLTQLRAKPTLIKIDITDEDIVSKYGEALQFWIYDRQPIDTFVKLATANNTDFGAVVEVINDMILDEEGNKIIVDDFVLPSDVMSKVVTKVVEVLGK